MPTRQGLIVLKRYLVDVAGYVDASLVGTELTVDPKLVDDLLAQVRRQVYHCVPVFPGLVGAADDTPGTSGHDVFRKIFSTFKDDRMTIISISTRFHLVVKGMIKHFKKA